MLDWIDTGKISSQKSDFSMRFFEFENNIDNNDGLAVLKLLDHNSVTT